tara:strand:+ start:974 stop:1498 length:525 start_codon:yes stop_codon:yes gene_type:complete
LIAKKRRLNKKQRKIAEDALQFVKPTISIFRKRNLDLLNAMKRVDMVSVANHAVCLAAFTYDPSKSKPTTYFGSAIRHALYREVLKQQKQDGRYICTDKIIDPVVNRHRTRQEMRAMKALKMLGVYDRTLLEDRLVEQVTLERLGYEQDIDPRTVAKRVKEAIEKLREAESDLP